MKKVLVIFAHPQFHLSHVNKAMVAAITGLEGMTFHDLYERYPDFYIDIKAEQTLMTEHDIILLQHPFQWYSCPALMKEWIDLVLQKGWAYGDGGTALQGKKMMNVITAGGPKEAYQPSGYNRYTTEELLKPFEQTANLCGMEYLEPLFFHGTFQADNQDVERHALAYRHLLEDLING